MIVNRLRFKIASLVFTYLLFLAGDPGTAIAIPPQANSNDIQAKLPWMRRQGASKAQGAIVFVHGVLGDAITSWQNGNSYWPELLTRDPTFDGQDIYVYEYPSRKLGKSFSISEVAENLRLRLSTDGVLKYKQMTFVSHSMGGLVTRDFIVKYQSQVAPKIRLLAFFATPTTGTPYARLAALVSKNSQFGQLYPLDSDNYLETLQSYWQDGHFNIRSYCAYEVRPILGQIIVEQASATHLCTEHLDPIDADHIDIVKPLNAKSDAYRVLVSAFEETATASRSTSPRNGTTHGGSSGRSLPPLTKEEIWSVLIPFNDGDGDPIPPYKMTAADAEKFPSVGLFYTRISGWSKSALEGRDRPQTPEAINSFLEEIVRYHVFDWVDQLQHDRYSQSWDYRTGAKANAILANAPPDFVEYPRSKVIVLVSNTPLGSVGDVMTYWRSRIDGFRVPANSTLQFLTNAENGADAYRIQISNPSLFILTLSVFHGMTLLNYGFVPPQFELTPETIKHTRSYDIVVKGRLEFKRSPGTDPLLQDEYVKWAEGLFAGLRNSMVPEAGPRLPEPAARLASGSSEPESKSPVVAPTLVATGKSEIVARLFMRGMMPLPPATTAEFSPIFQEFFYDWILTLEPEGPTGDISIVLKEPQKHEESIKIMPDIATVSGPTGKWMSGFRENARQNPDYYETAIRFPEGLDKDRPAKIVFRRPIKIRDQTTFTLQDFSRTLEVSATKAEVVKNYYDEAKQFELISLQLRTLLGWKYSGANSPPVRVRDDPNTPLPPLSRGEIETTLEVRCDNEAIGKKIVVQQMEARKKDF